jgi:hypothetical protein
MGAEAVKGEAFNNSDDSLEPEAKPQELQKPVQLLDSAAPESASSRHHQMPIDSSRYLYKSASKAQLRALARVQNVLLHHTSIDTIGDFSASALEILDDRIKSDSLTAVLVSLLVNVHGAPLRALSRSLQRYDTPLLHSVLNVVEPSSHSISGEVSGAEITIGDEEFLLQRGVLLDSLGDTLLEPGQQGFFLLIAISDAVVARVLITPPRIGDGKALVDSLTKEQIPVQIFSLGSSSQETRQFAAEVGVSAEQIYAIDSMLHLDSFLDQRKPFLFVSSDIDCAAYVSSRGLVAILLEHEPAQSDRQHLLFRGLGLNSLVDLLAEARRLVRREKLMMIGLGALGVGIFIIAVLLIRS